MSEPIAVSRWGHDHWSTYAFLAARIAKHRGVVAIEKMRCCPTLHHRLAHFGSRLGPTPPTRLRDGETLDPHDDWSCVEDAIAAGLVTMLDAERLSFAFTEKGRSVAAALQAQIAVMGAQRAFAVFVWDGD